MSRGIVSPHKFMPITSSAKKALRSSVHKRINNLRRKAAIDSNIKKFRKLLTEKKVDEATALLPIVHQAFDKAAKIGYIKANTAARGKSRSATLLEKARV